MPSYVLAHWHPFLLWMYAVFWNWANLHSSIVIATLWVFFFAGLTRPFPLLHSLVLLPSTIAHEFTHFFVAMLFGASPTGFSLLPKLSGEHLILGSVTCARILAINAIQVGLAPFLLFPVMLLYVGFFDRGGYGSWEPLAIHGFVVFSLLSGCIPSSQDFKTAFVFGWIVMIFLAIAAAGVWLFFSTGGSRYGSVF